MRTLNLAKKDFTGVFSFLLFFYAIAAPVSISLTNLTLALLYLVGLLWFIGREKNSGKIIFEKKIFLLFSSLFLWAAITALISKGYILKTDISKLWEYSVVFILPFLIKGLGAKKERIIFFLLLFSSIVFLLGIIQYLFPAVVYPFPRQLMFSRFQGFFSHPLHASGVFSITLIIGMSVLFFYKMSTVLRTFLVVFVLLNAVALVLTFSRSYYISATFAFLILCAYKSKRGFFYGMGSLLIVLIVIFSFSNPIKSRIVSLTDMNFSSNFERIYMWKTALRMTADSPIIGVGAGSYGKAAADKYFPKIKKETGYSMPPRGHAHNSYLTWLSECGIPGLILFIAFWGLVLKRLLKIRGTLNAGLFDHALVVGTIAALCNLFVAALFEHNLGTSVVLLSISFMIGLSLASEGDTAHAGNN